MHRIFGRLLLIATFGAAASAFAQNSSPAPATSAQIDALQKAVQNAQSAGDNAWMLVSAALVLLMTGPGLALFYGGLVRKKNILGTMMQSFAMMGMVTDSLGRRRLLPRLRQGQRLHRRLRSHLPPRRRPRPDPDYAPTIPEQTYMIYQLMFAIITPALITGAFAERMKFSAMALFLSLWSLLVYCPMAHMVWGIGGLLNSTGGGLPQSRLRRRHRRPRHLRGLRAGHARSTSASASAIPRPPCPRTPWSSASSAHACYGSAGSASTPAAPCSSGPLATTAFVNTHFAAAAAALGWTIAEWIHNGKPTALGAISGAVAGLVAITPASGFVQPMAALAIGILAGFFCFFMVFMVKARFRYDDSLDAFGVHGAGGTLGAILTGLFAVSVINPAFGNDASGKPIPTGVIDGHWGQILNQLAGVAIAWIISMIGTVVLLFIVDKIVGLRLSLEDESAGLDVSQHGEEGYDFNT